MEYGLKVLRKDLERELSSQEEYQNYSQSEDSQTKVWAERNLSSIENRIENLKETIEFIKVEVTKRKEEKRQEQMEKSKK